MQAVSQLRPSMNQVRLTFSTQPAEPLGVIGTTALRIAGAAEDLLRSTSRRKARRGYSDWHLACPTVVTDPLHLPTRRPFRNRDHNHHPEPLSYLAVLFNRVPKPEASRPCRDTTLLNLPPEAVQTGHHYAGVCWLLCSSMGTGTPICFGTSPINRCLKTLTRLCSKVIADRSITVVIVSHGLRFPAYKLHVASISVPQGHSLAVSAAKADARVHGKGSARGCWC
jgi:hypothetical protein